MKYFALITCLFIFASCKDEQASRSTQTDSVAKEVVAVEKKASEEAHCASGCPSCGVKESFELKAPNGGALMALGGDVAVLELVVNHKEGAMAIYMHDGLAKKQITLEQEKVSLTINAAQKLKINLKADENGVFRARSDIIKGLKKFEGTITELEVDGLPFDGTPVYFPQGN